MAARATTRVNLTDRARRYRAQNAVKGPRKCVLCGSTRDLGVMHLDGNESHGEPANLAWGCRSCNQKLAAAFKAIGAGRPTNQYNPSKGVPTFDQYAWAVSNHTRGEHDEAGAVIHATPRHKRIEYASRIWAMRRERGTDSSLPDWARNPGKGAYAIIERPRGGAAREIGRYDDKAKAEKHARELSLHFSTTGTKWTVKKVKANPCKRRNPATASADAFKEFHGYEPTEVVKVTKQVHHHKHLASAGDLVGLAVLPISGGAERKIEGLGDALLTFNEKKNQLFVTGGDQRMSWAELKKFGCTAEHELQTLGKLKGVGYYTDKTHLGSEGGQAIYSHTFRTTNEWGRHITVKIAKYPDLIYRVLDEQFEISGGSYTILREGIDK